MFVVYVLKSKRENWFYIGMTSNLFKRLKDHNQGKTQSTKSKGPFEVVYFRKFKQRSKARDYEKYLKIRSNKEKLLRKLEIL